jgi:hypothetical protein
MVGIIGRRGYRILPDWSLVRDDQKPDVVCDLVTKSPVLYNDADFAEGYEREFDWSLQAKLEGLEVKVIGDNIQRPEVPQRIDKLLWKWGSYFDVEFVSRDKSYLKGLVFKNEIVLDAPYNQADGYGNIGINFLDTMLGNNWKVSSQANWQKQNRLDDTPQHLLSVINAGFDKGKQFGLRLSQPDSATMCPGIFKTNLSMWEFPVMPDFWVPGANAIQLCLVPCGWNKQLWREGGVTTTTAVLPLGFNDAVYYPPRERKPKSVFTFYTDGSILGGNNLIQEWEKRFGDRQDLRLVIKFPYDTKESSRGNIQVIKERVSTDVMRQLYHDADCFLYPTQAEGFGLFPLEAMATGLPVVCTRLETMYSFINPKIAFPVDVESIEWFHKPDMTQFMKVVESITVGKWDFIKDTGLHAANHVHKYWTWQESIKKLGRILGNG